MGRISDKQLKENHRQRGWGGARAGAGRPLKSGVKKVPLTISTTPEIIALHRALRARGFNPAGLIEERIGEMASTLGIKI